MEETLITIEGGLTGLRERLAAVHDDVITMLGGELGEGGRRPAPGRVAVHERVQGRVLHAEGDRQVPPRPQVRDRGPTVIVVILWRRHFARSWIAEPLPGHARPKSTLTPGKTITHQQLGEPILRQYRAGIGTDEGDGVAYLIQDEQQGRWHMD